VRAVQLLGELADDGSARGVGEKSELLQMFAGRVAVRRTLERRADEYDAFLLCREGDEISSDGADSSYEGERPGRVSGRAY
jgi:hypothetical protein